MTRSLIVRFDTTGDMSTASSRLRAWKLAEFLTATGHLALINEGERCDVYVCQKSRRFATLKRFTAAGALTVYDLDDHFLLSGPEGHGLKEQVVAFLNAVDVVSVGSQYLARAAERYHPNVFCFENPIDIKSTEIVRPKTAALRRIGWFGTPAGLVQLDAINSSAVIETITRGGDIEFDLETIDSTLVAFDLLLLPVAADEWSLAKNANRMTKALALGIPLLASAVPEHIAAANRFGLDNRFLVREGENWDAKIAELRADFADVQDSIFSAREQVLRQVSLERIGQSWLGYIEQKLAERPKSPRNRPASVRLGDCAIIAFSHRAAARVRVEVDGAVFGQVSSSSSAQDFLKRYDLIWQAVCSETREWIVLLPEGFGLAHGFAEELAQARTGNSGHSVFLVRSHALTAPPDNWGAYALNLREAICSPRDPGVLVLKREWLLQQPWRPSESLSYWSWLLVIEALCDRSLAVVATPVVWRTNTEAVVNVCREYRIALESESSLVELPNDETQWLRFSADIFARLAERFPAATAASFARLISRGFLLHGRKRDTDAAEIEIQRLERQLSAVYRSASWRITAPLRALAQSVRRIVGW